VNLIFSYVHPSEAAITLGPFDTIWLSAAGLHTEAKGAVRAAYVKHQWVLDGLAYFRLDCTAQVAVRFERGAERSSKYGPYRRFSAVDGLAYGDDKVIAFMDQKSDEWLYYDTGYHWPTMVVSEALH
jgi:hypothetical protein